MNEANTLLGFKGARVATGEDWASVVQQNKQPRSDEHQTKWQRVGRSARAGVAALYARVAKKILPETKCRVEIFLKPLACPCRYVLWTKRAIDEHLITCSFLSYAESQNPAEKECCFGLHSSKKRMVLTDFGFVYLHLWNICFVSKNTATNFLVMLHWQSQNIFLF